MKIIYEKDMRTARLDGLDNGLVPFLSKVLSFKKEGIEYTKPYKNYLQYIEDKQLDDRARPRLPCWDGVTRLLTKKLKFPAGLVTFVEKYLKEQFSQEVEIVDNRVKSNIDFTIDISEKLKEIGREPRDYQTEAVEAMVNSNRGIVKAATGSGKTGIAVMAVAKLGKKANIYVIGTDLLYSFHEDFSKILPFKIGMIGNGVCDIQDINIVSIWSCGRALGLKSSEILDEDGIDEKYTETQQESILRALSKAKVHILDECHIASCETIKKIYEVINPEHLYGLSGTPFRKDNQDLLIKSILGEELIDVKASRLIRKGVLAKPIINFVDVPKMRLPATYQECYKEYIVENDVRNDLVVKHTKKILDKGYVVLVLFNNISHGKILADKFTTNGIEFGLLNGKDDIDKRKEVLGRIKNGSLNCIIASRIFDIGIDAPRLSGLVLAGSGKSYVRTLQRCGRVIRGYPGKKYAAIIDFHDQVKFFKKHSEIRKEYYQTEEEFKIVANF
jgi:superfamily II DNA or RNA helicase